MDKNSRPRNTRAETGLQGASEGRRSGSQERHVEKRPPTNLMIYRIGPRFTVTQANTVRALYAGGPRKASGLLNDGNGIDSVGGRERES